MQEVAVVATDRFTPSPYGYIYDDGGLTAVDQSGTIAAQKVRTGVIEERAYYSFATAPIPDGATIDDVTFRLHLRTVLVPVGIDVGEYKFVVLYDHDRIGNSITTDDWGGYAQCGSKSYGTTLPSLPANIDVTLTKACVNNEGDTDLEVQDDSAWSVTADGPEWNFHGKWLTGMMMWIDVTYTLPTGLFNRWNWKLPALPGFSNVIAAVFLPSGELKVMARFYPRPAEA